MKERIPNHADSIMVNGESEDNKKIIKIRNILSFFEDSGRNIDFEGVSHVIFDAMLESDKYISWDQDPKNDLKINADRFPAIYKSIRDYRQFAVFFRRLNKGKFDSESDNIKWALQQPENLLAWESVPQHVVGGHVDIKKGVNIEKISDLLKRLKTIGGDISEAYNTVKLAADFMAGDKEMPDEKTIAEILKKHQAAIGQTDKI